MPDVFVGSIHHCSFENFQAILSPLRMTVSDGEILYAESCVIGEMNLSLVHEFVFKKTSDKTCVFAGRFMNVNDAPVPEEISAFLFTKLQEMAEALKEYCEKMETSLFEPAFQKNKMN